MKLPKGKMLVVGVVGVVGVAAVILYMRKRKGGMMMAPGMPIASANTVFGY
jgi:hypothetical protein